MTSTRGPRRRHSRALLAGLLVAGVAAAAPAAGTPRVAGQRQAGVELEGSFTPTLVRPHYDGGSSAPYAQHVALAVDSADGLLYSLDVGSGGLTPTYVAAYRLTGLRPAAGHGTMLSGFATAYLTDPRRRGLLVAVSDPGPGISNARFQPTTMVERLVASHGVPRPTTKVNVGTALGPGQTVLGLAGDPRTGQVFAVSAQWTAAGQLLPGTTRLSLIDLTSRHPRVQWSQPLQDCQLPLVNNPGPTLAPIGLASSTEVDLGCTAEGDKGTDTAAKPPTPAGVGVATLAGTSRNARYAGFTLYPIPGDTTAQPAGVWDPGTRRMALQVDDNGGGTGWYVFDGAHQAYVGELGVGSQPIAMTGLDPVHGRLYLLSSLPVSGLSTADLAPTPVGLGPRYSEYAADPVAGRYHAHQPSTEPVAVDPATGRLFLYYDGPSFVVARDTVPHYAPPPPANPDTNTVDIAEQPGVTGSTYSGSAQGYGSVVRQVGGEQSLLYNAVPVDLHGANGTVRGTRELDTSYLDDLQLQSGGGQASAITAQPDPGNTGQQIPQQPVSGNTVGGWPYTPAHCQTGDPAPHPGWTSDGAQVTCGASEVSVAVVGGGTSAPSLVSVAGTSLSSRSTVTAKHGTVTEVTSVAHGISLLDGALRIGQVSVTALARAHGRPHTAGTTFTRVLRDVEIDGKTLCATDCDPAAVAEQINAAFAGRALVEFPKPDRRLAAGSPGGYQAVVQRDPYSEENEITLDAQPGDRAEVPGLQATLFEDNSEPSRTVVYLAGVEAEAHYGIYRLGQQGNDSAGPPASTLRAGGQHIPGGPSGPATVTSTPANVAETPTVAPPTGVAELLHHGWRLLVGGLGDVMRLLGVWLVLLAPVYLSARRWLLTRRHEVTHV